MSEEQTQADRDRARKALDAFISGFCDAVDAMAQDQEIGALAAEFAKVRTEATKAERERCAKVCDLEGYRTTAEIIRKGVDQ